MTKARHRKKDQPGIWWFPVWRAARQSPQYHENLYYYWLQRY